VSGKRVAQCSLREEVGHLSRSENHHIGFVQVVEVVLAVRGVVLGGIADQVPEGEVTQGPSAGPLGVPRSGIGYRATAS